LIGGTWWSSDMIAPKAVIGKPLRVARLIRRPTARRGCG
jgi:hypothetical protein